MMAKFFTLFLALLVVHSVLAKHLIADPTEQAQREDPTEQSLSEGSFQWSGLIHVEGLFPINYDLKVPALGEKASVADIDAVVGELEALLSQREVFDAFYANYLKAHGKPSTRNHGSIFKKNVLLVARQNLAYYSKTSSWEEEINMFSDFSPEELRPFYFDITDTDQDEDADDSFVTHHTYNETSVLGQVPAAFDWRDYGCVSPIKYQGGCGSCWTFSAIGATEGALMVASQKNGKHLDIDLSEQELVDCVYPGEDGCGGGDAATGINYIIKNGVSYEENYKYTSGDTEHSGYCSPKGKKARVKAITKLRGNEEEWKVPLINQGPAAISLQWDDAMFRWRRGVYQGPCNPQQGHAVVIVAYGSEGGNDFWVLKNSHSTQAGKDGFLTIARNKNMCDIANRKGAVFVTV